MGFISLNMIKYGEIAKTAYELSEGLKATKPEQYEGDACFLIPIAVHNTKGLIQEKARDLPSHYKPLIEHLEETIDSAFSQLTEKANKFWKAA